MFSNFSGNINFDFKIITNNSNYKDCDDIIFDDFQCNYVGFLKYSKYIPEGYDAYIYLDSDILFFGSPRDLITEKEYSCVIEDLPMTDEWFLYKKHDRDYIDRIKNLNGFNAGTFCFKNLDFLKKIRNSFEPHITDSIHLNARLEQSSYNFILSKEINFDTNNIFDLTSITQLFADMHPYTDSKKIYHFCGFSNEMQSKFFKMKSFYDKYKRSNI
jgi:hypothetical protein